jgi:hypothetical protein
MRRAVLVLLAVAAVLVVAAGAVVAANSTTCEADGGGCVGTREADTMTGRNFGRRGSRKLLREYFFISSPFGVCAATFAGVSCFC